jgi:hypothetical protein
MLSYKSDYPNQVHQLIVSVSKHYYFTKDQRLKYQSKPMEVKLDSLTTASRTHLVHYVLRDHCSGLFYSEIAMSTQVVPVEQFLYRAWGRKDTFVFCGLPDLIMVPTTVEVAFPDMTAIIASLSIRTADIKSGFQGGIGNINTIENWLSVACGESFEHVSQHALKICRIMSERKSRNGRDDRASLWLKHVPPIRLPVVRQ